MKKSNMSKYALTALLAFQTATYYADNAKQEDSITEANDSFTPIYTTTTTVLEETVKTNDITVIKQVLSDDQYSISDLYKAAKFAYENDNEDLLELLIESDNCNFTKSEILIELVLTIIFDYENEFHELLETAVIDKDERELLESLLSEDKNSKLFNEIKEGLERAKQNICETLTPLKESIISIANSMNSIRDHLTNSPELSKKTFQENFIEAAQTGNCQTLETLLQQPIKSNYIFEVSDPYFVCLSSVILEAYRHEHVSFVQKLIKGTKGHCINFNYICTEIEKDLNNPNTTKNNGKQVIYDMLLPHVSKYTETGYPRLGKMLGLITLEALTKN